MHWILCYWFRILSEKSKLVCLRSLTDDVRMHKLDYDAFFVVRWGDHVFRIPIIPFWFCRDLPGDQVNDNVLILWRSNGVMMQSRSLMSQTKVRPPDLLGYFRQEISAWKCFRCPKTLNWENWHFQTIWKRKVEYFKYISWRFVRGICFKWYHENI